MTTLDAVRDESEERCQVLTKSHGGHDFGQFAG
jgi:hypothetical protein